jgi:4-hydroxy-tetrahydrodipicolinate synthase
MLPQTVLRLAEDFENIVGIKEASGDFGQIQALIAAAPGHFLVISGDDLNAVPVILGGGAGVISVLGQGIPDIFSGMVRLALEGDLPAAMEWHTRLQPLVELLFREGNPAGIKGLLEARGICTSAVRLPLVALSGELAAEIEAFLKAPLSVL